MKQDKKQNKKTKKNLEIKNHKLSGLSAFVKRPVPSDNEVTDFEEVLDKEIKHQEIDSNLNEIYRDKKGGLVDVKKMNIKKRNKLIVRIFKRMLIFVILFLAASFAYIYYFTGDSDMGAVEFKIEALEEVLVGEEFSYKIIIKNPTKFTISKVRLELNYPENFIFSFSEPQADFLNNGFNLPNIPAGSEAHVLVTGEIIAPLESVNIISGNLHYTPLNFSSQFKKESSAATVINGLGLEMDVDYSNLVFVGQNSEINLSFSSFFSDNYLSDFIIEFDPPQEVEINLAVDDNAKDNDESPIKEGPNSWLVSLSDLTDRSLVFNYLAKKEPLSSDLSLSLKQRLPDGQSYTFLEKILSIEAVKSDLNIALFLNGSKNNQAVNFGEILNYTLNYSNKGESSFKDAVITAVLDGFMFDLASIETSVPGEIRSGQIIWNKQDIPALAEIKPGEEGEINFSVKLKDYNNDYSLKDMEISVYSQYGGDSEGADSENKSNVITSPLNSNLSIIEEIKYFDENNLPVGSGPLPPRVNEATSFRVYWRLKNNLHELKQTEVKLALPKNISWLNYDSVSVGDLYFDQDKREVIWSIGRLPASVYQTEASFSISLTPQESDRDKILVLSPGASSSAIDTETKQEISAKSGPKTTKLEDDDIAALNNSGRVE
jgi:uncharacterized repeat protein (TIGR01451 family)